jgi:hypothetical protein
MLVLLLEGPELLILVNLLLLVIRALQPLGLLYICFLDVPPFHCQMSPRPMRRARSEQREVELNGRERVAKNFA